MYVLILLLCGCSRLGQPAGGTLQLERVASGLQQAWPVTFPLQMYVTVKGPAGHEYLYCQLGNRSGDVLQLNQSELPWITPGMFDVAAVNEAGRVVARTGIMGGLMNGPSPISLGPGQTIGGNIALKHLPPLPRDQDLLLVWSYSVEMFGRRQAYYLTGITFFPKTHFSIF